MGDLVPLAGVYAKLRSAIDAAGSQREFAKLHDMSEAYVSDVMNASRNPGPAMLRALGFEKVTGYRRMK